MANIRATNIGLEGELPRQLSAEHKLIPCDVIHVPESKHRSIDKGNVALLKKSLRGGQEQPIKVKRSPGVVNGCNYTLLFGAHRLAAWKELRDDGAKIDTIACYVVDGDISDEASEISEIKENLHRQDITTAKKESMSARLSLLEGKFAKPNRRIETDRRTPESAVKPLTWPALAKEVGLTRTTCQDRWKVWLSETGQVFEWKNVTHERQREFVRWQSEAGRREDTALEAAEKIRKIQADADDAKRCFDILAKTESDYGSDMCIAAAKSLCWF